MSPQSSSSSFPFSFFLSIHQSITVSFLLNPPSAPSHPIALPPNPFNFSISEVQLPRLVLTHNLSPTRTGRVSARRPSRRHAGGSGSRAGPTGSANRCPPTKGTRQRHRPNPQKTAHPLSLPPSSTAHSSSSSRGQRHCCLVLAASAHRPLMCCPGSHRWPQASARDKERCQPISHQSHAILSPCILLLSSIITSSSSCIITTTSSSSSSSPGCSATALQRATLGRLERAINAQCLSSTCSRDGSRTSRVTAI